MFGRATITLGIGPHSSWLSFPGMTSSLAKSKVVNKSSVHTFKRFFNNILMFLSIHIFITLNTNDQQFTLTTKKSLHIIFKLK